MECKVFYIKPYLYLQLKEFTGMDLTDLMRGMDTSHIRRANTRLIIEEVYQGKAARFAEAIGRSESYVSRMLTDNAKSKVNIGPRLARTIEEVAGKPKGWLDVAHHPVQGLGEDVMTLAMTIASLDREHRETLEKALDLARIELPVVDHDRPQLRVVTSDSSNTIHVTDPREMEMLWVWRHTNESGRSIMETAMAAADSFIQRKPSAIPQNGD